MTPKADPKQLIKLSITVTFGGSYIDKKIINQRGCDNEKGVNWSRSCCPAGSG